MKTLILAAGRGKRLAEISADRNKCMLSICNKPLIEYSLDCAIRVDSSEIIIVIGYQGYEIVKRYGHVYQGKRIVYVEQNEQHGLVHAIECAKDAIGNEDFMLLLGDEMMINPKHEDMLRLFKKENLFGVCGVVVVEDINLIKKTYSVIEALDNRIIRLIEKPVNPQNNIMGTGNCIFKNRILSCITLTPINQGRGEKELPDLIQCAIDEGNIVKSFVICDKYVNVNSNEELQILQSYFTHT